MIRNSVPEPRIAEKEGPGITLSLHEEPSFMRRNHYVHSGKWLRHLIQRKEVWKTTWKFRVSIIALLLACFFLFKGFLIQNLAESLVCECRVESAEAAVIVNFEPNYLLFEETEKLVRAGKIERVLVPVPFNRARTGPNASSAGFVEVMARISRIQRYELVLIDEQEPIRYTVATQVRDWLRKEQIRSIVVVSPGFSSRRDFLIYRALLEPIGVQVSCLPVFSTRTPDNWTESWHGVQEVFLEVGKLLYYELVVL